VGGGGRGIPSPAYPILEPVVSSSLLARFPVIEPTETNKHLGKNNVGKKKT
jgi:hypothetical protein